MTSSDRRLDVALVLLFLVVVAPFVQTLTAQGGPRYALSSALVEQGTVQLDDYEPVIGIDRVEIDGHVYSDKAPGQPFMGAAVALVADLMGAEPATEGRIRGNLGVWAQTLVFCTLPGAALLVLMRRHASRHENVGNAALASVALAFGTILLPLASNLYGHLSTAMLLFAAWHLLSSRSSIAAVAAAGALAALAVVVEYPSAMVAGVLGVWVLRRRGIRSTVVYGTPFLLAAAGIVAHNQAVYGTFNTGYSSGTKGDSGRLNFLDLPDPANVFSIFFGSRGFIFTPIVLLGVGSLVMGVWRRRPAHLVPAATFLSLFLLQAGWVNPWGGSGPGPRYIAPALPFLVLPVAHALGRLSGRSRAIVIGIGVVSMSLALLTYELLPTGGTLVVTHLRYLTGEQGANPTLFTMLIGPTGWIVHLSLVGVMLVRLRSMWREELSDLALSTA